MILFCLFFSKVFNLYCFVSLLKQDFNKKDDILKPVNPVAQKPFMTDSTNIVKGGLSQTIRITPKSINVAAITKV